jgi:zinc protease
MATRDEATTDGDAVRDVVLDNGLRVLVREVHTAPLASVWCWYRVGSKDEPPGLTGVSHWVEHMNFKGTTNIPATR